MERIPESEITIVFSIVKTLTCLANILCKYNLYKISHVPVFSVQCTYSYQFINVKRMDDIFGIFG
jgi:hypothetical protein